MAYVSAKVGMRGCAITCSGGPCGTCLLAEPRTAAERIERSLPYWPRDVRASRAASEGAPGALEARGQRGTHDRSERQVVAHGARSAP